MRLVYVALSKDEAANPNAVTLIEQLVRRLSVELDAASVTTIGNDSPDVGAAPPVPTPAVPVAPPALQTASLGFGVPGSAGAVPPLTAPAPLAPAAGTSPTLPPASIPPVPAPASAAPAPSAPATPTNPVNVADLDKNGLPWDERIHAGTKNKVADGTWKKKKGLNDAALVARVEAELRAAVAAAPAAPPAPAAPAAPVISPAVAAQNVAAVTAAAQAASAVAAPPVPAAPPMPMLQAAVAPAVVSADTAPGLLAFLAPHMASKLITPERQAVVLGEFGIANMPGLMNPAVAAQIPAIRARFEQYIAYWQAGGV